MHTQELVRLLHNLIRLGTIEEIDPVSAQCRIRTGALLTAWLPWLTLAAGNTRCWQPPSLGEQVLLLCPHGELSAGVVLQGLYSDAYPAPSDQVALSLTHYHDGARCLTQAKARKAISIPLSDAAVSVLMRQKAKGRDIDHAQRVFVYRGKSIKQTTTKAWYNALKATGIKNFRWHDLRHTWASWHVQRGTLLYVLKELGGWETLEMVQRYAHLSSEHLAQWALSHTSLKAPGESSISPTREAA